MGHYDPREEEREDEKELNESLGKAVKKSINSFSDEELALKLQVIFRECNYLKGLVTGTLDLFNTIRTIQIEASKLLGMEIN